MSFIASSVWLIQDFEFTERTHPIAVTANDLAHNAVRP